jgi:hypothetical protein
MAKKANRPMANCEQLREWLKHNCGSWSQGAGQITIDSNALCRLVAVENAAVAYVAAMGQKDDEDYRHFVLGAFGEWYG